MYRVKFVGRHIDQQRPINKDVAADGYYNETHQVYSSLRQQIKTTHLMQCGALY